MKKHILYLFTRTPLHVGAGSSVGALDQPVQREHHTGFPIIPGSSIKGVLADHFLNETRSGRTEIGQAIFGYEKPDHKNARAGTVAFGEAKILAFPVRSARGSFAFITCPLVLSRFQRDHENLGTLKVPDEPDEMCCLAGSKVTLPQDKPTGIVLEEYKFTLNGPFPADWESALLKLLPEDPVWKEAAGRLVLLNNGDFSHFVRTACEVSQHVAIDWQKGTAKGGALFDLEAVPSETLFYSPLTALNRAGSELEQLREGISGKSVLQFGGDNTTGLGFCSFNLDGGNKPS